MRGVPHAGRLWPGLIVLGMVASACTIPVPGSQRDIDVTDTTIAYPFANPGAGGIPIQEIQITVNVDLTDDGFEPSTIYIPAGRGVQLFLRNRGTTEHHYRIAGLVPAQLSWLASTAYLLSNMQVRPEDISEEDHLLHHLVGWAPFRDASLFGIRPIGNEVHGYAASGDRDIVRFIATNTGTFRVEDVLHPEISGEVVVFSP